MKEPLLDLAHVSVARGNTLVLRDISLTLGDGEHLAILGPNGCGKSTLLKTLTCELYPLVLPQTRIQLFGRTRWDLTALRRRLGVVAADPVAETMLRITGAEAVLTGFFSSSAIWPHLDVTVAMRDRAADLLRKTAAEHLGSQIVGTMSAGEQRRIMIARALAGSTAHRFVPDDRPGGSEHHHDEREMLLLDEPSNALDLAAQQGLRTLLRQLARRGTSILLITHHVGDILPEMRRILLMKQGAVVEDGLRERVLTSANLSRLFGLPVALAEKDGILTAY